MARQSGVRASGFRYPEEVIEELDLVRREIVFSAEGSYKAMRRFLHSLERSDQFLVLENIGVNDSGGGSSDVRVRVEVSTLFLGDSLPGGAEA